MQVAHKRHTRVACSARKRTRRATRLAPKADVGRSAVSLTWARLVKMGPFTREERNEIWQGRFQLDCLGMTLRRQGSGTLSYAGAGEIRQNADRGLEFVLYDSTTETDLGDLFRAAPAGTFLSADEFFRLEAEDIRGQKWTAEWVHISRSLPAERVGGVVRGRLDQIVTTAPRDHERAAFVAFIPRPLRIPINHITETTERRAGKESTGSHMDSWSAQLEGIGELFVRKMETGLDVVLTSEEREFPKQWDLRFEEAMSFVLGEPFRWLEFQVLTNGELRTVVRTQQQSRAKPRLQPPVSLQPLQKTPGLLLAKFLSFLLSTPPHEDRHHPVAASLARVYRASASDIEDEALLLAIEVERLVREHHIQKVPIPDTLRVAVGKAKMEVAEWSPEIRNRLIGALDGFLVPSAPSILHALREKGVLESRHVSAWKAARNRETHGRRSSKEIEELVDENNVVHQALLLIIFELIGYDGAFSDYTVKGWSPITQPRVRHASAGDNSQGA